MAGRLQVRGDSLEETRITTMGDNIIFHLFNVTALLGWSSMLLILLSKTCHVVEPLFSIVVQRIPPPNLVVILLYVLEGICLVEVGRIAAGKLKGNLLLGGVLHAIRITCLVYVLSEGLQLLLTPPSDIHRDQGQGYDDDDDDDDLATIRVTAAVLYSWSITEVCRYPMYLFPSSSMARYLRLVVPIFTFPVGCAAEAYGAIRVVMSELVSVDGKGDSSDSGSHDVIAKIRTTSSSWVKIGSLTMVILINVLLGPLLAYPALLKKGLPVLMGKKSKKNERPKRE